MPNESVKDRAVTGYLKPCNQIFFVRYINRQVIGKSEAINNAVEALKKSLPPAELKIIMGKNDY